MIDEVIAFHRFWDLGPLAKPFGELGFASGVQCVRDGAMTLQRRSEEPVHWNICPVWNCSLSLFWCGKLKPDTWASWWEQAPQAGLPASFSFLVVYSYLGNYCLISLNHHCSLMKYWEVLNSRTVYQSTQNESRILAFGPSKLISMPTKQHLHVSVQALLWSRVRVFWWKVTEASMLSFAELYFLFWMKREAYDHDITLAILESSVFVPPGRNCYLCCV